MELWFTEKQNRHLNLSVQVKEVLEKKTSSYQDIVVLDTAPFGRMLVLDGFIQVTEIDEFIYHEMIVHVPLVTHGKPENILIVGGGDGGSVREALRHPTVKKVTLVEIDREVVEVSRRFFPEISASLSDARVSVIYEDGVSFLQDQAKDQAASYDVIVVDSTEPVGPAESLFSYQFYDNAAKALHRDGVLVAQTESPFHNRQLVYSSYQYIKELFPVADLYLAPVPSYPGGLWSFALGSLKKDPRQCQYAETSTKDALKDCRYYSSQMHGSAFALPPFLKNLLSASVQEKDGKKGQSPT